jgi:GABA(A) receptor-associated protein
MRFKEEVPLESRRTEAAQILERYPDRLPIICERVENSRRLPELDKKKYLVPRELSIGQFVYVIRRRIKMAPEQAMYLFVNGSLPPTSSLMASIYEEHKDEDGFLYILYGGENTFG